MSQLGLATDVGNPNFAGATNPDAALFVEIYSKPLQNNFQTEKQKRPIFEDVVMIRIHTPGNQLNIVDRPLFDSDKLRWPLHWARYENAHKDGGVVGTPLEHWPLITGAVAEMLKAVGFKTVEMVANASDGQLQSMGMHGGMAPTALRDRARTFLQAAAGDSAMSELKDALAAKDEAMAQMQAKHDADMAELKALILAKPERKKPGRKPRARPEEASP